MPGRILLLGVLLTLAACQASDDSATSAPTGTNPPGETAQVTFVFDGDSFEATVGGQIEEVRLLGINAPEEDECFGDEARMALDAELGDGEIGLFKGGADDRDDFGRLLRYVSVDGRNVNETMIFSGHAVAVHGDHPLSDSFSSAAEEASFAEIGMWDPAACGPVAGSDIVIAWVEYNPPGPDDEVLNDEYVEIVNEGSVVVDLAGWTLRDESSQNRYTFDRSLLTGERVLVRSGCGDDRGEDVYWCAEHSIWSNGGDTAILQDTHGNVVFWRAYRGG
jgi:micrococcal nuclease